MDRCSRSARRTTGCRFCANGSAFSGDGGTTYDKALAEAVKKFQQGHELKTTGTLTNATIEALNGRRPDQEADTIIANMERWRWMPHDLGKTYVIVNLPDYTLRVMHDGKQVWMTKIVVGKPGMPTPIMTARDEVHHDQPDLERAAVDHQ